MATTPLPNVQNLAWVPVVDKRGIITPDWLPYFDFLRVVHKETITVIEHTQDIAVQAAISDTSSSAIYRSQALVEELLGRVASLEAQVSYYRSRTDDEALIQSFQAPQATKADIDEALLMAMQLSGGISASSSEAVTFPGAWTSYTPTVTPTGSMAWTPSTDNCAYQIVGNTAYVRIHLAGTIGGTPYLGGGPPETLSITLPLPSTTDGQILTASIEGYPAFALFDSGAITLGGTIYTAGSNTLIIEGSYETAATGVWTAYTPAITPSGAMTWSSSVLDASYIIEGNLATVRIYLEGTIGGTPGILGGPYESLTIGLPAAPATNDQILNGSIGGTPAVAPFVSGAVKLAGPPFIAGANTIIIQGVYEAL